MERLLVDLEHCYGIKKLEYDFDLSNKTASIYAPNGAMKTSFAKVFRDISTGSLSSDLIFPTRETVCKVTDENGTELDKNSVFVIDPIDEEFKSEKMSTLLVNKELREKYDKVHLKIDEVKEVLLKELKALSGVKKDIEDDISEAIMLKKGDVFTSLIRIKSEVLDKAEPEFSDILYKNIFNDKAIGFLETKDFKNKITEYIAKYDELIDSSSFFKRGVFNHNNASVIAKNLTDNGFFKAKHAVSLNASGVKKEVNNQKELEEIIEQEKKAILDNPELVKAFEEIDAKLKANKELRDFRDYLLENNKILPELGNIGSFKQTLWISYLKTVRDKYVNLVDVYQAGEKELKGIIEQAKKEGTDWLSVIEIFNKRFSVPFVLEVENQADVILKNDIPNIIFVFKDQEAKATVDKSSLLKALSNGEKRALYILNIIFEVEARKKAGQETLFIIDDIADSFDYKNKYAIIEYLKEISEVDLFYQIILSHNFDFFRTIESRFVGRKYSFMIIKTDDKIELIDAEYLKPFTYFRNNLHTNKHILVASIPFVRNLVEYTKETGDDYFQKLTSLLHIKEDSNDISIKDLEAIINDTLNRSHSLEDSDKKVLDLIFELATDLSQSNVTEVNLENKIVLSIAIRLKAEEFMINKINDASRVRGIEKNQTFELFKIIKDETNPEPVTIKTLEQVNLMTPENIHFNSFMYEPILDMSDEHLKRLYNEVAMIDN